MFGRKKLPHLWQVVKMQAAGRDIVPYVSKNRPALIAERDKVQRILKLGKARSEMSKADQALFDEMTKLLETAGHDVHNRCLAMGKAEASVF